MSACVCHAARALPPTRSTPPYEEHVSAARDPSSLHTPPRLFDGDDNDAGDDVIDDGGDDDDDDGNEALPPFITSRNILVLCGFERANPCAEPHFTTLDNSELVMEMPRSSSDIARH
ncbi:unnamed protein product [Lampetra planeri]